jgi:cytochrome P450
MVRSHTMSATAADARRAAPAGALRRGAIQLARFGSDPLAYVDGLRDVPGDIVSVRLGSQTCHVLRRPELVKAALVNEDWPPLSRGRLMGLDKWYSGGLILTEGEEHHRQRDTLWKPLLADGGGPEIAVARASAWADSWSEGQVVELFGEFRDLVWSIDWQALTGEDVTPELLRAQAAGIAALEWLLGPFGPRRWGAPTPASARTRAARRRLDAAIAGLVAARREEPREDLLSRLVAAEPDDAVVSATFKQWLGADQLHGLFTWALHLLASHPEVEAGWHAEVDALSGPPGEADIAALPLTVRIVHETLRLYPPVWTFFRAVTRDYALGDHVIPAGDMIVLSPYFVQREPSVWPDPERFDPERWAPGAERPPDIAFFPFSAGPYECHAHGLAMQEAVLVLATLGRRFTFRPLPDARAPRPVAAGAIEPKGGLRMQAVPRR